MPAMHPMFHGGYASLHSTQRPPTSTGKPTFVASHFHMSGRSPGAKASALTREGTSAHNRPPQCVHQYQNMHEDCSAKMCVLCACKYSFVCMTLSGIHVCPEMFVCACVCVRVCVDTRMNKTL